MRVSDEQAVEFLQQLIEIYSPSRQEAECVDFLVKKMREFGLDAHVDNAGNAVGIKNGVGPQVLLFSHVDTVEGKLEVKNDGSFLYGRGACDAKGPLAALVVAAARSQAPMELIVAGVVEEEIESSKGAHELLKNCNPQYCILGEPTNTNAIAIAYKGRLLVKCVVKGEKGHSASGIESPVEQGINFFEEIKKQFDVGNAFNKVGLRITFAQAGNESALNVNPDSFTFVIDIRLPPSVSSKYTMQKILELKQQNIEVEFSGACDASETRIEAKTVRATTKAIRKQKLNPTYLRKLATSDFNISNPKFETVVYGPGDSKLDHTDEERISIQDFLVSIKVIENTLEELALSPQPQTALSSVKQKL